MDDNNKKNDNAKENEKLEEENNVKKEEELKKEENEEKEKNTENVENTENDAKKEIEALNDKYVRLFAEFQNYRNRTDKEKNEMYNVGIKSAILKMLPVVDNIERALSQVPDDIKNNSFVDGIDKVYKQIEKIFEEMNIKPIETIGKEFDVNLHNAVMTDEEGEGKPDTITAELLKGYTIGDEVLRPSMVKVKK